MEYGRVQGRVSRIVNEQAATIRYQEAEIMKLRALVIVRDSALAWERDNYAMLKAAMPGLERRAHMASHILTLQRRIEELVRERTQRLNKVRPHFLNSQF